MTININNNEKNTPNSKVVPLNPVINQGASQPVSTQQMMALLMEMLTLVNEVTALLIKQQNENETRQLGITQANADSASKAASASAAEAIKNAAKIDKADHLVWWKKMLKIVLPIVSVLVAFVTFGVGAGAVAALTVVVSMLLDPSSPIGQLGQVLQKYLPKGVMLAITIGITIAMTVACASAGARFAVQEGIAAGAEEVGTTASSSALQVADESASSVALGSEQAAGSGANAAQSVETQLSKFDQFTQAMKNPKWFLGANALASTFAATQPILYIVAVSKKESLEKAEEDSLNTYLTLAVTLLLMVTTMTSGFGASMSGSTSLSEAVSTGLKNMPNLERFVQLGLRFGVRVLPWVESGTQASQGGLGIATGGINKEIADIQAEITKLSGISSLTDSTQKQSNQMMQQAQDLISQLYKDMGQLAPSLAQVASVGTAEARAMMQG